MLAALMRTNGTLAVYPTRMSGVNLVFNQLGNPAASLWLTDILNLNNVVKLLGIAADIVNRVLPKTSAEDTVHVK